MTSKMKKHSPIPICGNWGKRRNWSKLIIKNTKSMIQANRSKAAMKAINSMNASPLTAFAIDCSSMANSNDLYFHAYEKDGRILIGLSRSPRCFDGRSKAKKDALLSKGFIERLSNAESLCIDKLIDSAEYVRPHEGKLSAFSSMLGAEVCSYEASTMSVTERVDEIGFAHRYRRICMMVMSPDKIFRMVCLWGCKDILLTELKHIANPESRPAKEAVR